MYPLAPADLAPYPGRFLREDADRQALAALREAWPVEAEERPESVLRMLWIMHAGRRRAILSLPGSGPGCWMLWAAMKP